MFEFITDDQHTIRHQPSGMLFEILLNPEDGDDYDAWIDTYQEFEFKGNHIVCLMLNAEDFEPEPEPIGYQKIHAINRKAFKFYKSKVFIESFEMPEGDFETERFLLQKSKDDKGWVLTDKTNEVVVTWQNGNFNETQKITPLNDIEVNNSNLMFFAKMLREAGDWLVTNHNSKI